MRDTERLRMAIGRSSRTPGSCCPLTVVADRTGQPARPHAGRARMVASRLPREDAIICPTMPAFV